MLPESRASSSEFQSKTRAVARERFLNRKEMTPVSRHWLAAVLRHLAARRFLNIDCQQDTSRQAGQEFAHPAMRQDHVGVTLQRLEVAA